MIVASATSNGTLSQALLWGVETNISNGVTVAGGMIVQSSDDKIDGDTYELKNKYGVTVGHYAYNARQEITMEIVPGSDVNMPRPGTVLTAKDSDDLDIGNSSGTKFIFINGTKKKSQTGPQTWSMTMRRYLDGDVPA